MDCYGFANHSHPLQTFHLNLCHIIHQMRCWCLALVLSLHRVQCQHLNKTLWSHATFAKIIHCMQCQAFNHNTVSDINNQYLAIGAYPIAWNADFNPSHLVNGNYRLWYRPFSYISVSADISARLGTEISAGKNCLNWLKQGWNWQKRKKWKTYRIKQKK